jgi:hypothetical protein
LGHNNNTQTKLIIDQCNVQQKLFLNDFEIQDKYCSGPILEPFQCCFCFYNEYPSFILDEVNYNDHNNSWHEHYNHMHLKDPNISKRLPDGSWNSYKYKSYNGSYYFCMEQRKYTLYTNYSSIDIFGPNSTQQIIALTGKWGFEDKFKNNVTSACDEIKKSARVDDVKCYYNDPEFVLQDKRYERHMRYLVNESDDSTRGGGYWFHKAAVIRHNMNVYNDNDYLIWVDIDAFQRLEPLKLHKIMSSMHVRNADFAFDIMNFPERDWTKEDILVAFNSTNIVRSSHQLNGQFQVVRISNKTKMFYDALLECNADYHMISDEPSKLKNRGNFKENRHDQSILSLFYKTFLSNQTVIGPPAQPVWWGDHSYTFTLDNSVNVVCPFQEFYKKKLPKLNK